MDMGLWPPAGAQPVDLDGFYAGLADVGYGYGPLFQGLQAAWTRDGEVFAEVMLPAQVAGDAARFGIHPALLDAALHAGFLDGDGELRVPFEWRDVSLHAVGATAIRVRLSSPADGHISLTLADTSGELVARVGSLITRPLSDDQGGRTASSLFRLDWATIWLPDSVPDHALAVLGSPAVADELGGIAVYPDLDALLAGSALPDVVIMPLPDAAGDDAVSATHTITTGLLSVLQRWLAEERLWSVRLVIMTRGAVATRADEDIRDLAQAAVWGLVRTAQTEEPGRFVLADVDASTAGYHALRLALDTDEPEVALRGSTASAPRLARTQPAEAPAGWDPDGAVVITGASGVLGGLVARHLVEMHGVRRLILLSRRGMAATPELAGAEALVFACDVADRDALAGVFDSLPADWRISGVVHTAGVLDDGVITALTLERLQRVMAPKVDGAWNLHELTREMDLDQFVLFSSAAGVFGTGGQGNYAAANVFLDALAQQRRSAGLAGRSLAWGFWAEASGMTAHLDERSLQRLAGGLSTEQGLALFDAADAHGEAMLVATPVNVRPVRSGPVPHLLRGLVRGSGRRVVEAGSGQAASLRDRLAAMAMADRVAALVPVLRVELAAVLGYGSGDSITVDTTFRELGIDSLMAVEFRNHVRDATTLNLPVSTIFDHPTLTALAGVLAAEIGTADVTTPTGSRNGARSKDTTVALFENALRDDRMDAGLAVLSAMAGMLPTYENADSGGAPHVARLSQGLADATVAIMVPPVVPQLDDLYELLVGQFPVARDVYTFLPAGFADGEPIPASLEALFRILGDAAAERAGDTPLVLVGHSSGGWIAHGVASYLTDIGQRPAALVLLDTFWGASQPDETMAAAMADLWPESVKLFELLDSTRLGRQLVGMGGFLDLFEGWERKPIEVPTLHVRASEYMSGEARPDETGEADEHVVRVPGNHFSIVSLQAGSTARVVDEWLTGVL